MKRVVILSLTLAFGALQLAHGASTDSATEADELNLCKEVAVQFALEKEMENWGDGVVLQSIDRAVNTGSLIKPGANDDFYNVEITLDRESTDPIVYEMALIGRIIDGKATCELTHFVTRNLL